MITSFVRKSRNQNRGLTEALRVPHLVVLRHTGESPRSEQDGAGGIEDSNKTLS